MIYVFPALVLILAALAFAFLPSRKKPAPSSPTSHDAPEAFGPDTIIIILDSPEGRPTSLEYAIRDAALPVIQAHGHEVINPGHIVTRTNHDGTETHALVITHCVFGLAPAHFAPAPDLDPAKLPRAAVVEYTKEPTT